MNCRIIGLGEVLWDLLPSGPQLGGAPANFAGHARALGADATIITRIGSDALGRDILDRFAQAGLPTDMVQVDATAPTGTVTVALSGDGLPHYTIHENVAWDRLTATEAALEAMRGAAAVCFGTLAQRSATARAAIQELVAATPPDALRVLDINLRQHFYSREIIESSLRLANVLKLNDGELPVLAEMFGLKGAPPAQIKALAEKFDLRLVALTRGAVGSWLWQPESGGWSECAPAPVEVADTVGAGDAFTATLVMGLLQKMPLAEINALANEVARYVCSCPGATPPLPETFHQRLRVASPR